MGGWGGIKCGPQSRYLEGAATGNVPFSTPPAQRMSRLHTQTFDMTRRPPDEKGFEAKRQQQACFNEVNWAE